MSHAAMNLVRYVARALEAGDFEPVVDKKGVVFFRVEPGKYVWWGEENSENELSTEVKSAAVYRRKNESLQILANIGGVNVKGKKWARGVHLTLKPVNPTQTIVLEGNRYVNWITRDYSNQMRDRLTFT